MTTKVCLRCDWEGDTEDASCPRCGTRPLYVQGAPPPPPEHAPLPKRPPIAAARGGISEGPAGSGSLTSDEDTAEHVVGLAAPGRSPRLVVFVLVLLVTTIALGTWLRGAEEPSAALRPSGTPSLSGMIPRSPLVSPSSPGSPTKTVASVGLPEGPLAVGTYDLVAEDVPFSIRVPFHGWENHGDHYISKSSRGPQGADAMILWTDVSRGDHARACGQWWGSPVGSVADWAESASKVRGTDLVSGPSDVTLGGLTAQQVVFTVRRDVACQPAFFFRWRHPLDRAFWGATDVGDTIRLWLVDVAGKVLVIEADSHAGAGSAVEQEIDWIVRSIRFETGRVLS